MQYLLGLIVLVAGVLMAVALIRNRDQVQGCCCPTDPRNDARMRGAFEDEPTNPGGATVSAGWSYWDNQCPGVEAAPDGRSSSTAESGRG